MRASICNEKQAPGCIAVIERVQLGAFLLERTGTHISKKVSSESTALKEKAEFSTKLKVLLKTPDTKSRCANACASAELEKISP